MMTKVYPTSEASLVIAHPIHGKIRPGGSDWTVDGFTCRMLADHALTSNPQEAWAPKAPPPPPKAASAKDQTQ